jgi:hypothetical protein
MEFTTKFLQITYLGASIYRLQKTKTKSDTISQGSVRTVAKGVRTAHNATGYSKIALRFFPE